MLDKKDFKDMLKESREFDEQRELLIKKSRDVLKLSKQVIYSVHRNEISESEHLAKDMKKELEELNKFVKKNPKMYHQGSYKIAVQEYVEAVLFLEFVKTQKVATRTELNVETDYYLLGICDLSGELFRKAVLDATKGNYDKVLKAKETIEEIYTELLKFDIRESELRKKFDSIKYDLRKLEDLCLELKLKDKI